MRFFEILRTHLSRKNYNLAQFLGDLGAAGLSTGAQVLIAYLVLNNNENAIKEETWQGLLAVFSAPLIQLAFNIAQIPLLKHPIPSKAGLIFGYFATFSLSILNKASALNEIKLDDTKKDQLVTMGWDNAELVLTQIIYRATMAAYAHPTEAEESTYAMKLMTPFISFS